jgi:5-methylcytosine-specific restriction endonuclease McrA
MKQCSKCKKSKELSEFYAQKGGKLGKRGACKQCVKEYASLPSTRKRNNAACRAYYQENKDKNRVKRAKRRAALKRALCDCCSSKDYTSFEATRPEGDYHLDHIIPLSKGGKHCLKNFQWLTAFDNRSKKDKIVS